MLANIIIALVIVVLLVAVTVLILIIKTERKRFELLERNWHAEKRSIERSAEELKAEALKEAKEEFTALHLAHRRLLERLEHWRVRKLEDLDQTILTFMTFDRGENWYLVDILPNKAIKIRKKLLIGEDDRYLEKLTKKGMLS